MKHLMIIIVSLWNVLLAQELSIERRVVLTNNIWTDQPDTFIIPSSVCSGDGSIQCSGMGGRRIQNCKCACDLKHKSTFGFYEGRWKCTENTKARSHGGCTILLNKGKDDSPLIAVPMYGVVKYYISTNHTRCFIGPFHSYLKCDGTWRPLDKNIVTEKFSINEDNDLKQYLLNNQSSSNPVVTGRVITIALGCYNEYNLIVHQCVLLKMQGQIKCPLSLTTPTTPATTTPATTTSATTTSAITTESSTVGSSPIPNIPTSETRNTKAFSATLVNKRYTSDKITDHSALIAGSLTGVVALVAVIVIVVVMVMRRKKRTKRREDESRKIRAQEGAVSYSKDGINDNPSGLPGIDQSSEDKDYTYDYATNTLPDLPGISQSAMNVKDYPYDYATSITPRANENGNQGHEEKSSKLANGDSNNYGYESMEGLNNIGPPDHHLTKKGPIYESLKSKANSQHEGPENSSVYGSLVGNDPHVYGSLNVPHKTPKEVDTYQQLNPVGQRSKDIYQALSYNETKT